MAVGIFDDLRNLERPYEFRPEFGSTTKFELDVPCGQQNPLACNIMCWASVLISIVFLPVLSSLHYEFPGSFNRGQFGLLITLNSPETLIGQTLLI